MGFIWSIITPEEVTMESRGKNLWLLAIIGSIITVVGTVLMIVIMTLEVVSSQDHKKEVPNKPPLTRSSDGEAYPGGGSVGIKVTN